MGASIPAGRTPVGARDDVSSHSRIASAAAISLSIEWVPLVLLVGAAVYFVLMWSAASGTGVPAYDIYMYYYPNMLAAVDSLHQGGRGLLWDPYLDCGHPFFGSISVGLLSPTNVLHLFLSPEVALRSVVAVNMAIAGVFAYLLCRELGAGALAAFCGALAFELANATVNVSAWSPIHAGAYVWMPAVMLFCERILRAPSVALGLALAATLSIALLPGFPQTVIFMYQLVVLRVAWEFASRRVAQRSRTLLVLALGLLAPPLFTAVQLVPALEVTRLSLRSMDLPLAVRELGSALDWASLQNAVVKRRELLNPFVLIPFMLACASLTRAATIRPAVFYFAAALLFFVLSFGPATPLYDLYALLPVGAQFRMPVRLLWVTGFCLSVLTALGTQAIIADFDPARVRWRRTVPFIAAIVGAALYAVLAKGLTAPERALGFLAVAGMSLAVFVPRARSWGAIAIATALAINLLWFPLPVLKQMGITTTARPLPFGRLLKDETVLRTHASVFDSLRARITPQDRTYSAYQARQLALGPKTASLFHVSSVQDYDPLASQRYARYFVFMRTGQKMESFNQYYFQLGSAIPLGFQKRLLNAAAGRYLVVDARATVRGDVLQPPTRLLIDTPALRVYENPDVLARARFVPRIEVVADSDALLHRLAFGSDDLRQVALVEVPPASGFTGGNEVSGPATVEFVTDDPEHIVLRVEAPSRGFVALADQDFPGWTASVNQIPTPIVRANYVFRLVEVPAGLSTVEFRYAPSSLPIGAVISSLSLLGAGALLVWARGFAR